MSLRELAEADLAVTLEDPVYGFGWAIKVTDPADNIAPDLVGFSQDIAQVIDPDTGVAVSGRLASVALRISSLTASPVVGLPQAIADPDQKPWVVEFDDINGTAHIFKVSEANPDRTIGMLICSLEAYDPGP